MTSKRRCETCWPERTRAQGSEAQRHDVATKGTKTRRQNLSYLMFCFFVFFVLFVATLSLSLCAS